jgi:hypothetical protein
MVSMTDCVNKIGGGGVDPRGSLYDWLYRDSISEPLLVQPAASRYADCINLALL